MKKIYEEYISYIKNNFKECELGAFAMKDYLLNSPIAHNGRCIRTVLVPKIYTPSDLAQFKFIVDTTYGIFEKVIKQYLNSANYRSGFPFSKELEELILTDRGYRSLLPIARFDIFYNEDTKAFKFCEINTDGTAAMNEDYMLNKAYAKNPAHQHVLKNHALNSWELFDSWVREFIEIYSTYKNKVEKPYIAIVDFLEKGTIPEFKEFKRRFEKAGYECEVCEISSLIYDGHNLYSPRGKKIDAVYRRAVTSDIMSRIDEVLPFLNAVKDENVCVIGAFCTQIIHSKWLFKMLHDKSTQRFLTEAERAFIGNHVPFTNLLSEDCCNIKEIISEKDKWIIKPIDSYASSGVFAGCDCSLSEWEFYIRKFAGKEYIYQEYCPQYRAKNICFTDGVNEITDYINMAGLYVYNGKFSGVYSRVSNGGIIKSYFNECDVPSYYTVSAI